LGVILLMIEGPGINLSEARGRPVTGKRQSRNFVDGGEIQPKKRIRRWEMDPILAVLPRRGGGRPTGRDAMTKT